MPLLFLERDFPFLLLPVLSLNVKSRLKLEEGRTAKSIISEYGVSKASITKWCQEFREECQSNPEAQKNFDSMKEILRLKKELEEVKKENLFLKKAAAFFAKEID